MLAMRREHPEMGLGTFTALDHGNDGVIAFIRTFEAASTLVLANFTDEVQVAQISEDGLDGRIPVDRTTGEPIGRIHDGIFEMEIGPYEFHWLALQ